MEWDFIRSHGLGNDYLVADSAKLGFELTPARIREICHRHTGVGSDGVLLLSKRGPDGFALRIFNPDGSEAEKSGNGLRIFAKFLYDHGYTRSTDLSIRTLGGPVKAKLLLENGRVTQVRVDMGQAVINRSLTAIEISNQTLPVIALSMGNPHCIVLVNELSRDQLLRLGPQIENHPAFPNRTNVQFAQVLSSDEVNIFIWERGAGHTLASGSSACAVAAACFDKGLIQEKANIQMEGGKLDIEVNRALNVIMTGPVEEIGCIQLSPDLKQRLLQLRANY